MLDESGKVIASHDVGGHVGVENEMTVRISNLTLGETQFHAGKNHDKKCPPGCQNHCCIETYMIPNQVKIEQRKISCIAHCACERCSIKLCPESCECHLCVGEPICRRKCSCPTCQISTNDVLFPSFSTVQRAAIAKPASQWATLCALRTSNGTKCSGKDWWPSSPTLRSTAS